MKPLYIFLAILIWIIIFCGASLTSQTYPIPDYSHIKDSIEYHEQVERSETLFALMMCESGGDIYALGDDGDSLGLFQWQKPSLEDVMSVYYGERISLTHEQYTAIATNYEEAYFWTEYAWFDLDQSWRWYNCREKMLQS